MPYLVWARHGYPEIASWCDVDKVFWVLGADCANEEPLDVLFWQPISFPDGQLLHNGTFLEHEVFIKNHCRQLEILKGITEPTGKAVN